MKNFSFFVCNGERRVREQLRSSNEATKAIGLHMEQACSAEVYLLLLPSPSPLLPHPLSSTVFSFLIRCHQLCFPPSSSVSNTDFAHHHPGLPLHFIEWPHGTFLAVKTSFDMHSLVWGPFPHDPIVTARFPQSSLRAGLSDHLEGVNRTLERLRNVWKREWSNRCQCWRSPG